MGYTNDEKLDEYLQAEVRKFEKSLQTYYKLEEKRNLTDSQKTQHKLRNLCFQVLYDKYVKTRGAPISVRELMLDVAIAYSHDYGAPATFKIVEDRLEPLNVLTNEQLYDNIASVIRSCVDDRIFNFNDVTGQICLVVIDDPIDTALKKVGLS